MTLLRLLRNMSKTSQRYLKTFQGHHRHLETFISGGRQPRVVCDPRDLGSPPAAGEQVAHQEDQVAPAPRPQALPRGCQAGRRSVSCQILHINLFSLSRCLIGWRSTVRFSCGRTWGSGETWPRVEPTRRVMRPLRALYR